MTQNEWKNIAQIVFEKRFSMRTLLTTEQMRIRLQFFCIYLIMAITSLVMTVVNVLTGWHLLMLSTLVFTVVSAIDVVLALVNEKCEILAQWLFAIEALLLCNFFIAHGEPEGFSAIWALLLPTGGMLLYRRKFGTLICAVQFLFIILMFWTPLGRSLLRYDYTESFLLRFPLLYASFFAVGYFLEHVRDATQQELTAARAKFIHLSKHDALTGVYNRTGFDLYIKNQTADVKHEAMALALLDIDDFKKINDTYGHTNGDIVLHDLAEAVTKVVRESGAVCRWGGEEFAVLLLHRSAARQTSEYILDAIRRLRFDFNGQPCRITVSLGLVEFVLEEGQDPLKHMAVADANLYAAKNAGKDRMVVSEI